MLSLSVPPHLGIWRLGTPQPVSPPCRPPRPTPARIPRWAIFAVAISRNARSCKLLWMGRKRIGDRKSDLIRAFGNFDRLHANTYSRDKDQLYGFGGDDFVYVDDGDTKDGAVGGTGYDWCYVDAEIEAANSCDKVVVR